jgi:hypothetical protein
VEQIAVVGIPRKVNSKPEVSRPGAIMPQVAFLLEEWGEKQVLVQKQKIHVHSYRDNFNFWSMIAYSQHTT